MTAALLFVACSIWVGLVMAGENPVRSVVLFAVFFGALLPLIGIRIVLNLCGALIDSMIEFVVQLGQAISGERI